MATELVSDDFTGFGTGDPITNGSWAEHGASWLVNASSEAQPDDGNEGFARNTDSAVDEDCYGEITIGQANADTGLTGPAGRLLSTATTGYYYRGRVVAGIDSALGKLIGGSNTTLDTSGDDNFNAGDVCRVEIDGRASATIKAFHDTSAPATTEVSDLTGNTDSDIDSDDGTMYVGMTCNNANATDKTVSDFSGGNLADPAAGGLPAGSLALLGVGI